MIIVGIIEMILFFNYVKMQGVLGKKAYVILYNIFLKIFFILLNIFKKILFYFYSSKNNASLGLEIMSEFFIL